MSNWKLKSEEEYDARMAILLNGINKPTMSKELAIVKLRALSAESIAISALDMLEEDREKWQALADTQHPIFSQPAANRVAAIDSLLNQHR